jgi:hypothetical protein
MTTDPYKVIKPVVCDSCGSNKFAVQQDPTNFVYINKTYGEDEDGWYVASSDTMPEQGHTIKCMKCEAVQDIMINCWN